MTLRLLATLFALALAVLPAAGGPKVRVVTTLADLWTLTRAVAGDAVQVDLALRLGQNPHDLEIRPSQVMLVRRADILVRNGLEEDAWVDPIVEGAGNPKLLRGSPNVIEAGQGVPVLKVPTGPIDRSMGDVHPLGNPHFTLDPENIPAVTGNIAAGLSRIVPDQSASFEANRQALLGRLATARQRWKAMVAPYQGARMVSYHDSWPYFYRAFGFVETGLIEDRPGVPPSPQHLAALIRRMKDQGVKVILLETYYSPNVATYVAGATGAKVLVLPQTPGTVAGTDDYIAHLDYLLNAIIKALE